MNYSLYELNHLVSEAIASVMDGEYWVEAELSDVRERTHCYMELLQNDLAGRTPVAKARACCWAGTWRQLRPKFERATGQPFVSGLKVRLLVSPNFHEAFGFSYEIHDVDPAYTLGDMAQRRAQILRRLAEEGVLTLQRELALPLFTQRIAVISTDTAAGYGDFCHQLADNVQGLRFRTELFEATMQGERVEASVIAALGSIMERVDDFDAVVIIRGGGATADMSGFDTLRLAEHVANFPLPIITGIGHDRDECVLDIVAHQRVKTPTAAATLLIDRLAAVLTRLATAGERITRLAARRQEMERMRIARIAERIPALCTLAVTRARHRIDLLAQRAQAADPRLLLQRGYSVTRCRGKIVRDPAQLAEGDPIDTLLAQGTLHTVVVTHHPTPNT